MKSLTQAKRDQARLKAERSIKTRIGKKPTRVQFNNYVASRFPLWFSRMVGVMLVAVALAAGIISGVRLYVAGFNQVREIVPFLGGRILIGLCTVLAAELLVILSTVAGQVYLHGKQKGIAAVPIVVGTAVAFVGNWTITDPASTWGWVETIYPPIAVLSVAFFFEISLVPELERRQADNNAFESARKDWEYVTDNVEEHPDWWAAWATAIRDELLRVNQIGIDDLTPDEWREAVEGEMGAEQWWNSGGIPLEHGNRSKQKRKSGGGLVDSVDGSMTQAEKVKTVFQAQPELADKEITPVKQAIEALGVGNSTYYAGLKLYERNGSNSDGSE
jgi:hypothetical protein